MIVVIASCCIVEHYHWMKWKHISAKPPTTAKFNRPPRPSVEKCKSFWSERDTGSALVNLLQYVQFYAFYCYIHTQIHFCRFIIIAANNIVIFTLADFFYCEIFLAKRDGNFVHHLEILMDFHISHLWCVMFLERMLCKWALFSNLCELFMIWNWNFDYCNNLNQNFKSPPKLRRLNSNHIVEFFPGPDISSSWCSVLKSR